MATTSNFGWETPDDTDYVKDGAAAMRTLGNSIDSSMADLKGGTTGQVLSKNTNTDMDFVWINNDQGDITAVTAGTGITGGGTSGAVTITNDMATTITAAGDIVVGTGSGTYDNLPIGTTGQILTADTTVSPYKVKWAAVPSATPQFTLLNAGGTALTGATTITVSGISDKSQLMIVWIGASSGTAGIDFTMTFNSVTSGYISTSKRDRYQSTYSKDDFFALGTTGGADINLGTMSNNSASNGSGYIFVNAANSSSSYLKPFWGMGATSPEGGANQVHRVFGGLLSGFNSITSVSIISSAGNFDAGTIYVYGA